MIFFWLNLILRLVLAAYVVHTGHWASGDTKYYLETAASVCGGAWGGDMYRTPGYPWFVCALSPAGAIFAQSVVLWLCGLWLYRRSGKAMALFWIFDPLLLAYSNLIMSDGLFAASVLFLGLSMQKILTTRFELLGKKQLAQLGLAIGAVILIRPIGLPLAALCFATLLVLMFRRRLTLVHVLVATLTVSAVLSPRIYWDKTRYDTYALTHQGGGWIPIIAGVLKYRDTGMDPYQLEQKFAEEDAAKGPLYPFKVIAENFHIWILYTVRGMIRVLIGHVNIEWTALLSGVYPLGPAWFGVGEQRHDVRVEGLWLVPWVLGILLVASYCLYVYSRVARVLWRLREVDALTLWLLSSILLLTLMPQLLGDSRFRAGVWPLVMVLWGWLERKRAERAVSA